MSKQKQQPKYRFLLVSALLLVLNLALALSLFPQFNPLAEKQEPKVLGVSNTNPGYKRRFTVNTQGGLIFTGNTITLSRANPGNGTAGTFMSFDPNSRDGDYGPGTTNDWRQNATYFNLNLPAGSSVLYAELIWGGNYLFNNNDQTNQINSPVRFFTPRGETPRISPDPVTQARSIDDERPSFNNYFNSQNVTSLVRDGGNGQYGCGAILGIVDNANDTSNYAGCTLAVAYQDNTQVSRNLTIFVGSETVNSNSEVPSAVGQVSGFITPPTGEITGKLFVSGGEGDSVLSGDQMRFGRNQNDLTPVSGPNNQQDNFFASQINGENGNVDTSGSFGSLNQNPSPNPINRGLRHGWDITSVNVSSLLSNGQTSAFAQGTSQGDGYVINALGIQIDIKSPRNIANLSGNQSIDFCVPENIVYTIRIRNEGTADSQNTIVQAAIPTGTEFVAGSVRLNGQPISGSIVTGVDIGVLRPGQPEQVVTYTVRPLTPPQDANQYRSDARVNYDFQMFDNGEVIQGSSTSNVATTTINYDTCPDQNPNPNSPPAKTPIDDVASTKTGEPVVIDVVKNDGTNQEFNFNCLRISDLPKHGRVEIVDGKIRYTPDPSYTGTDAFKYEICDALGNKVTATVRVQVTGNPRPAPQVLGAYDNILPRTGGNHVFLISLAIVSIICIGLTIIPVAMSEEKEREDDRREY
jgi:uncharacterized repeat protein (TIGR01451 family)